MKFLASLVCVAVTASVHGSYLGEPVASLYDNYHGEYAHSYDNYEPKAYAFEYGVSDPHTGDHKSQWETKDKLGVVRGGYSLLEPDGTTRIVEYIADKEGFRAIVKKVGTDIHTGQVHGSVEAHGFKEPIVVADIPEAQIAPVHHAVQPQVLTEVPATFSTYDGHADNYATALPDVGSYHIPQEIVNYQPQHQVVIQKEVPQYLGGGEEIGLGYNQDLGHQQIGGLGGHEYSAQILAAAPSVGHEQIVAQGPVYSNEGLGHGQLYAQGPALAASHLSVVPQKLAIAPQAQYVESSHVLNNEGLGHGQLLAQGPALDRSHLVAVPQKLAVSSHAQYIESGPVLNNAGLGHGQLLAQGPALDHSQLVGVQQKYVESAPVLSQKYQQPILVKGYANGGYEQPIINQGYAQPQLIEKLQVVPKAQGLYSLDTNYGGHLGGGVQQVLPQEIGLKGVQQYGGWEGGYNEYLPPAKREIKSEKKEETKKSN